jgi:hypothetical protein
MSQSPTTTPPTMTRQQMVDWLIERVAFNADSPTNQQIAEFASILRFVDSQRGRHG